MALAMGSSLETREVRRGEGGSLALADDDREYNRLSDLDISVLGPAMVLVLYSILSCIRRRLLSTVDHISQVFPSKQKRKWLPALVGSRSWPAALFVLPASWPPLSTRHLARAGRWLVVRLKRS